jgi:hypothetical protein
MLLNYSWSIARMAVNFGNDLILKVK